MKKPIEPQPPKTRLIKDLRDGEIHPIFGLLITMSFIGGLICGILVGHMFFN